MQVFAKYEEGFKSIIIFCICHKKREKTLAYLPAANPDLILVFLKEVLKRFVEQ